VTTAHLLDANALIALTLTDHEHHQRATSWAASGHRIALCPVVEGAFVRFLVRLGRNQSTAKDVLEALYASPRCEFWPDALSYRHTDLEGVAGYRQVTDAYLSHSRRRTTDCWRLSTRHSPGPCRSMSC
jgi:uncharacterized protein